MYFYVYFKEYVYILFNFECIMYLSNFKKDYEFIDFRKLYLY